MRRSSDPTEPDDGGAEGTGARGTDDSAGDLPSARAALVERLLEYDSLLEVGVGRRPGVAAALAAAGADVTVTDVHERDVSDDLRFVCDDVVDAAERARDGGCPGDHYDREAVYALNCPPELHRPLRDVARAVGAALCFTTLGTDQPAIPVRRETVGRATLFVVDSRG